MKGFKSDLEAALSRAASERWRLFSVGRVSYESRVSEGPDARKLAGQYNITTIWQIATNLG